MKVTAIQSFAGGGGSVFVFAPDLKKQDRTMLTSSSPVVLGTLLRAFMTGADIDVDTEEASPIIRRVHAFGPDVGIPVKLYGDYHLDRIATQRTKDGDYLEVFLSKNNNNYTFLVFDLALQAVFLACFETKKPVGFPLQINYDDKTVVSVRIGER